MNKILYILLLISTLGYSQGQLVAVLGSNNGNGSEPVDNGITPQLDNWRFEDGFDTRLYFDSNEIITASNTNVSSFKVPYRTVTDVTINEGQLTGHYLTISSAVTFWHIMTVEYTGVADSAESSLADLNGNKIYDFTSEMITNNINEPSASTIRYANATGSGTEDGTSEANAWEYNDAFANATSGMTVWVKAGVRTGAVSIGNSGTATAPIKFIGYVSDTADITTNYRKGQFSGNVDTAEMPTIDGTRSSTTGITINQKDYVIIRNIQTKEHKYGVSSLTSGASTNIIFDRCNFEDHGSTASNSGGYGVWFGSSSNNKIRLVDCVVNNAEQNVVRINGNNNLILDTDIWSDENGGGNSTDPDYYCIIDGDRNIVKGTKVKALMSSPDGGGFGIDIKPSDSPTAQYNLIDHCYVESIAEAISFRWEEADYNIAKYCHIKGSGSTANGGGVTFRDGADFNIFENGIIEEVEQDYYGSILFYDNSGEQGTGQTIEGNIVRNTVIRAGHAQEEANCAAIKFGLGSTGSDTAWTALNNEIINCTFYDVNNMWNRNTNVTVTGLKFTNNIVKDVASEGRQVPAGVTYLNSAFHGGYSAPSGTGIVTVDPYLDFDQSLTSQTPSSIYEGGSDVGIYYDANGVERMSPYSMGAYEYVPVELLFKTDFEGSVALSNTSGGGDQQYFSGSSLGYTFPTDGQLGMGSSGNAVHALHQGVPSRIECDLRTVTGHLGGSTTVLYNKIVSSTGTTQVPWQFNDISIDPDEFYMSYWIKLGANNVDTNNSYQVLWEYKTDNYDDVGDGTGARLAVFAVKDNSGDDYYSMQLDTSPTPVLVWNEENYMTVLRDEWYKFEIYFKFRNDNTGAAWVKINGTKILEKTNAPTTQGNNSMGWFMVAQNYGGVGDEQWIDDVEIWSTTNDQTAPTLNTITIEDADPTDVVMVFSEAVDGTNLGFTIGGTTSTTFASISGSGTTWTGVLADDAENGETITLSYDSGTGDFEDLADTPNALEDVTNQAVTNNISGNYGSELLDVTSWSLGAGITRDGTELTYNTDSNQGAWEVGLNVSGIVRFEYEIISYTSGSPSYALEGGTSYTEPSINTSVGVHVYEYDCGDNHTDFFIYGGGFGSGGTFVIDNISLKEKL